MRKALSKLKIKYSWLQYFFVKKKKSKENTKVLQMFVDWTSQLRLSVCLLNRNQSQQRQEVC